MSSIFATTGAALRDLEALLLPAACLGCGAALPAADAREACCAVCRSRMRAPGPPACPRCGQSRDPWERRGPRTLEGQRGRGAERAERGGCGFCRHWPEELAWAASATWMEDGPARELVHALKYDGWRVAAAAMADRMVRQIGSRLREVDVLVPVPLGSRRLRARGYNQAAVLGAALGARLGVRVDPGALVRSRETRSQTTLSPTERWRNVSGAFVATGSLRGTRVAVVDDVLTTGATLAACAAALASGGAQGVGAATFARAAVPD